MVCKEFNNIYPVNLNIPLTFSVNGLFPAQFGICFCWTVVLLVQTGMILKPWKSGLKIKISETILCCNFWMQYSFFSIYPCLKTSLDLGYQLLFIILRLTSFSRVIIENITYWCVKMFSIMFLLFSFFSGHLLKCIMASSFLIYFQNFSFVDSFRFFVIQHFHVHRKSYRNVLMFNYKDGTLETVTYTVHK